MELNLTTVLKNVSKNNDCDNNNASALHGNSSALHCQDFALKPMEIFLSVVLYSIIAIVGSLGNTLVLLLIKRTTNLKTTFGVLIANLAIADLLVTAVAVPLAAPMLIRGFVPTCSSNASVIALIIVGRYSCTASLLLLAAMSMDRCWAICYPLQHKTKMTSSKLKAVLLFIWLASLTLPTLEMVFRRENRSLSVVNRLTKSGIITCYVVFVTSGLLTFINVRCASSKISNMCENGGTGKMHAELRERNKQVAKTIALVVVVFSICWLPVAYIITNGGYKNYRAQNFWALLLGFANSAANPCIYFFRERSYRQALKVLLTPQTRTTRFSRRRAFMELNSTAILNNVSLNNDCHNTRASNSSALCDNSSVSHCQDFALQPMDIFVSVVLYNIIAIGGSLGNTLVLLVIKRTPNLKTACGVLIANLATADLLVTAVAVPLVISVVIQGCVPVCSLDASMLAAIIVGRSSAAASLLILAAMSIDRCWAICNPFQHKIKMTSSKLKTILLFVLLVSLVLPSLEVVFWRQSQLLLEIKHLQIFGVVICYFAIVTSGLVTFINVRCASWKISNLRENGEAGRAELRERNKQVGKTIALVVVAFSICWVPIVFISARFVGHYSALHFWGVLPGFANSAVNPCIYFYRHRSYRQALKGLLRSSHT
ncbi:hypothetical protein ACROYT_G039230 [Oculina patagonica]